MSTCDPTHVNVDIEISSRRRHVHMSTLRFYMSTCPKTACHVKLCKNIKKRAVGNFWAPYLPVVIRRCYLCCCSRCDRFARLRDGSSYQRGGADIPRRGPSDSRCHQSKLVGAPSPAARRLGTRLRCPASWWFSWRGFPRGTGCAAMMSAPPT